MIGKKFYSNIRMKLMFYLYKFLNCKKNIMHLRKLIRIKKFVTRGQNGILWQKFLLDKKEQLILSSLKLCLQWMKWPKLKIHWKVDSKKCILLKSKILIFYMKMICWGIKLVNFRKKICFYKIISIFLIVITSRCILIVMKISNLVWTLWFKKNQF